MLGLSVRSIESLNVWAVTGWSKGGEKRIDWPLELMREGALKVRVTAQSPAESDATEASFPVLVHGVERQVAHALRHAQRELHGGRSDEAGMTLRHPAHWAPYVVTSSRMA